MFIDADWNSDYLNYSQHREIKKKDLFIWALIFGRLETARVAWKNSKHNIILALAAALYFRKLTSGSRIDSIERFNEEAQFYENQDRSLDK